MENVYKSTSSLHIFPVELFLEYRKRTKHADTLTHIDTHLYKRTYDIYHIRMMNNNQKSSTQLIFNHIEKNVNTHSTTRPIIFSKKEKQKQCILFKI